MPPYYALGFYQGSDAYKSEDDLNAVINGYKGANINIEGIQVDKYYNKAKIFSND